MWIGTRDEKFFPGPGVPSDFMIDYMKLPEPAQSIVQRRKDLCRYLEKTGIKGLYFHIGGFIETELWPRPYPDMLLWIVLHTLFFCRDQDVSFCYLNILANIQVDPNLT